MLTFQEEEYPNVQPEISLLIDDHWKELGIFNKKKVPLKPKLDWYEFLYTDNKLHIATVRDNDILVGYYISVISEHIHYSDTIVADNDILYLKPEYRKGLTGYKLIKYAVDKLRDKVNIIVLSMKAEKAFTSIAKRLNFRLTDYKFTLEI